MSKLPGPYTFVQLPEFPGDWAVAITVELRDGVFYVQYDIQKWKPVIEKES
jgi:hypothetical protein